MTGPTGPIAVFGRVAPSAVLATPVRAPLQQSRCAGLPLRGRVTLGPESRHFCRISNIGI